MRILLTNDDGIEAPGLVALYKAIADLGEVHVVAPAYVQSATSHAITFHRPIITRQVVVTDQAGNQIFVGTAVEGRPADCVKLAMHDLVPKPVDLVISGMNSGANIGINVIYSGTVAAAMEAGFIGVPSIAVSLHLGDESRTRWDEGAAMARKVIDRVLAGPIEPHSVININIPILDDNPVPKGTRVVPISTSSLIDSYTATTSHDGHRVFQAGYGFVFRHTPPDSDVDALFQGYVTITPLFFDLTDHRRVKAWEKHIG